MRNLLTLLGIITCIISQAQNKSHIEFGKITADDFVINSPVVDSNTDAVVIADIGSSQFEGNNNGWFTLVFKRLIRIKILDQKGFDAANWRILLFTDNVGYYQYNKNKEELADLKAATYNIENGNVTATQLDVNAVFENKIDRNWIEKKFTLPAVKAGSIVEYSYTIKSDFFFNLQPWYFQGKYPCLWSEYKVYIPDCFSYIFLLKGTNSFFINEKKIKNEILRIEDPSWHRETYANSPQVYLVNSNSLIDRWVMKDVPAVKEESMVFSTKNYVSGVEFQLYQYRFSDPPENKMQDWLTVSKEFLERSDFGEELGESHWLMNELNLFTDSSDNNLVKAKKIFSFVRDNFTCTDSSRIYLSLDMTLRNIYKNKKGSESDINLLLTTMLKEAGLRADPVILSTRNHGVVHPVYPMLSRYNYVICRLRIDDDSYYLDASDHFLGFNKLPAKCFNGLARVVSVDTATLNFSADSLKEFTTTTIFINNDDYNNNDITGRFSQTLGNNESLSLRQKLSTQSQEEYFKERAKNYPGDIKINNWVIDSLQQYDSPLQINYDINLNYGSDSLIYINPMFGQDLKQNPFKDEETRLYPVELPYCSDDVYILNMQIPKGYKLEEIPKSARIKLDDDNGMFEYLIEQNENTIQLRCRLKINKAMYEADEYSTLRDFYSSIIKRESEQIIFRKIN